MMIRRQYIIICCGWYTCRDHWHIGDSGDPTRVVWWLTQCRCHRRWPGVCLGQQPPGSARHWPHWRHPEQNTKVSDNLFFLSLNEYAC